MIITHEVLGSRYAKAFHNINKSAISLPMIEQLRTLAVFFSHHKKLTVTLGFTNFSKLQAATFIEHMREQVTIDALLTPLLLQLTISHRLALLNRIAYHLEALYNTEHNRSQFTAYTSHALQESQKSTIIAFIQSKTDADEVVVTFEERQELISGIRIASETMMWERSIQKTLLQIKQRLLART